MNPRGSHGRSRDNGLIPFWGVGYKKFFCSSLLGVGHAAGAAEMFVRALAFVLAHAVPPDTQRIRVVGGPRERGHPGKTIGHRPAHAVPGVECDPGRS